MPSGRPADPELRDYTRGQMEQFIVENGLKKQFIRYITQDEYEHVQADKAERLQQREERKQRREAALAELDKGRHIDTKC